MDLFDLLEQKQANKEKIKESELTRGEYIRLNSYVGSRMNTDFRMKNKEVIKDNKKEKSISEDIVITLQDFLDK